MRQTSLDDDVEELSVRLNEISANCSDEAAGPCPGRGDHGRLTMRSPRPSGPGVLPADDDHYRMLVDEADNLVIFLGAGANADDHEGPFRPGAAMLPDDTDLAEYLAAKVRLKSGQRELAEVAQYARMIRGEPRMFRWVKQILGVDSEPGPVHRYLARPSAAARGTGT